MLETEASTDMYYKLASLLWGYNSETEETCIEEITFVAFSSETHLNCVKIFSDGSHTEKQVYFGGSADLGDISTALDHIIALQEELIGGDGQ